MIRQEHKNEFRDPPTTLKHRCNLPGFWSRLFNSVVHLTLWKCGVCNRTYVWYYNCFYNNGWHSVCYCEWELRAHKNV